MNRTSLLDNNLMIKFQNIDHQISEICRETKYQEYVRDQRLEIIDSYIFEEDNYGNKYFSPKNGEKQNDYMQTQWQELKNPKMNADLTEQVKGE